MPVLAALKQVQNSSSEVNSFPSDIAQHRVAEFGSVVTGTELVD